MPSIHRLLFFALALACTDGPTTDTKDADLSWYTTCGDPACSGYSGPFDGVPLCTTEQESTSCPTADLTCDLQDDCNALLICATEDPKEQEGGCPISRKRHKTDIDYVDAADLDRLRKEALGLRLATWRYTTSAPDTHPRLGFLLDDHPTGHAAALDGEHVDVYGLASLALAAVQAQQQEIDALRATNEALERRLLALEARR